MMKRIELLMKYNVKPLIVFDGRRAPLKVRRSLEILRLHEFNAFYPGKHVAESKRRSR